MKVLEMKRIAIKFDPQILTDDQKECQGETQCIMKKQFETNPDCLSKVMM